MTTLADRPAPGRARLVLIGAAALAAIVSASIWLQSGPDVAGQVKVANGGEGAAAPSVSSATMARFSIPAESASNMPGSLEGTTPPGAFTIDASGHFVPDLQARRLFDYFFSASGEEGDRVIRGRILLHALSGGATEAAVKEIADVLDRYMAYRDAAKAQAASGASGSGDVRDAVDRSRNLQLTMLGPELQKAFFGEDSAAYDLDLQRSAILRDRTIGEGERQRRLAELDARLPSDVREARAEAAAPTKLHQRVEALRASGGSETEVAEARRAAYGPDATARLEALDRERARWSERYSAYSRERDALRASYGGVDSPGYRASLEALRQRQFSEQELIRVRALDAAGGQ